MRIKNEVALLLILFLFPSILLAENLPPDPSGLPQMFMVRWEVGPDYPFGVQDNGGDILYDSLLISVGGYQKGLTSNPEIFPNRMTGFPGKEAKYVNDFHRETYMHNIEGGKSWEELPLFPGSKRQAHLAVAVDNRLYVWGGFNYTQDLARGEFYTKKDGWRLSRSAEGVWAWDSLPDLPVPLTKAGIISVGHKIFIMGGAEYSRDTPAGFRTLLTGKRLWMIDTQNLAQGFIELPSIPGTDRACHSLTAVGNKLYVIGGLAGLDHVVNEKQFHSTVRDNWLFDINNHQWSEIAKLPVATGNFPEGNLVYSNRYIFLVGGYRYGNAFDHSTSVSKSNYDALPRPYSLFPDNGLNSDIFVYDVVENVFGRAGYLPLTNQQPMAFIKGDTIHMVGGDIGPYGTVLNGVRYGHHPDLYLKGRIVPSSDGPDPAFPQATILRPFDGSPISTGTLSVKGTSHVMHGDVYMQGPFGPQGEYIWLSTPSLNGNFNFTVSAPSRPGIQSIKVEQRDIFGHAVHSSEINVRTQDESGLPITDTIAPQAPALVLLGSEEGMSLQWTVPVDEGGSGLAKYVVELSTDAFVGFVKTNVWPETTTILKGLPRNKTHYARVRAMDYAGNLSAPSNVVTREWAKIKNPGFELSAAEGIPGWTKQGNNETITLSEGKTGAAGLKIGAQQTWQVVYQDWPGYLAGSVYQLSFWGKVEADPGLYGRVNVAEISANGATGKSVVYVNIPSPEWTRYSMTFSTDAVSNGLRIRCYENTTGNGMNGNFYFDDFLIATVTQPSGPPNPPTEVSMTPGQGTMEVSWTAPHSLVDSYRVDLSTSSDFTSYVTGWKKRDVGHMNAVQVPGLKANTLYYSRVYAYNRIGGTSGFSDWAKETTPADGIPPQVSAIILSSPSPFTTAQTLSIQVDASDSEGVTKVWFIKDDVVVSTVTESANTRYSYAWPINALNNGTSTWTATAFDAAGNRVTTAPQSVKVTISQIDVSDCGAVGDGIADDTDAFVKACALGITVNASSLALPLPHKYYWTSGPLFCKS